MSSMDSDLILPITLSKSCLLALSKISVQGKGRLLLQCIDADTSGSYTARPNDLDQFRQGLGQHSHKHTLLLKQHYNLKMLWDKYEIVSDAIV